MKTVRAIAYILAWFNLIFWGVIIGSALLQLLAAPQPKMFIALVLTAAIPLNSYAAVKLHRSIRNPAIKLNHQTPAGIRFVGLFALLLGIGVATSGFTMLQNAKDLLPAWKEQVSAYKEALPGVDTTSFIEGMGVFMLIMGLLVIIGVVLNMRLLRWYFLVRKSDGK